MFTIIYKSRNLISKSDHVAIWEDFHGSTKVEILYRNQTFMPLTAGIFVSTKVEILYRNQTRHHCTNSATIYKSRNLISKSDLKDTDLDRNVSTKVEILYRNQTALSN